MKKLNLLPAQLKNKNFNHSLLCIFAGVIGIFIMIMVLIYGYAGILTLDTQRLQKEYDNYNLQKLKLEKLQQKVVQYKRTLEMTESKTFPFVRFMQDLELYRSGDVTLLSADTNDRLNSINSGETQKADVQAEPVVNDLSGQKIIIRGYSNNQTSISKYIYEISNLAYIADTKITGIEQHMLNGNMVNIFEVVVTGGALK